MKDEIGRNDPCPCGSGKKYKKCCLNLSQGRQGHQNISLKYRFEPGSYGDIGNFTPSIACLKQISMDDWKCHFVLVKPTEVFDEEDGAVAIATKDLDNAFIHKNKAGSDIAVAEYLKNQGYLSVEDFNIVKDNLIQQFT
jgi:hypothetical protein